MLCAICLNFTRKNQCCNYRFKLLYQCFIKLSNNLRYKLLKKFKMKKILLFALILRLVLAFFAFHPDVYDQLNWGKDLYTNGLIGFYERDIPDAGPPNYPPLYFLIITAHKNIYELIKNILWNINVNIESFPSNIYLWFESSLGEIYFNKILPIAGDFGIAFFLYKLVKVLKDKKSAKKAVIIFLLFTPSWYISSVWGQTDSLYLSLLLGSVYFLLNGNLKPSFNFYILSLLIKPIGLLIAPVYFFYLFKKYKITTAINFVIYSLFFSVLFYIPFYTDFSIPDFFSLYLIKTREISGYISSNAFNIWGAIYGFGPVADSKLLYGISLLYWGILFYAVFTITLFCRMRKTILSKYLPLYLSAIGLCAFMFLTRMHERYFYLPFMFLLISAFIFKKIKPVFIFFNVLFFINLYHYWWMPYSQNLKNLFSLNAVEFILCFASVVLFIRVCKLISHKL